MIVISIEIIDEIAIKELEDMELRNLIKFNLPNQNSEHASKRFWGKISEESAKKLNNHVDATRMEWERI